MKRIIDKSFKDWEAEAVEKAFGIKKQDTLPFFGKRETVASCRKSPTTCVDRKVQKKSPTFD